MAESSVGESGIFRYAIPVLRTSTDQCRNGIGGRLRRAERSTSTAMQVDGQRATSGTSAPLGATIVEGGVNFSVFSKHATHIELLLFESGRGAHPSDVVALEPSQHRTYHFTGTVCSMRCSTRIGSHSRSLCHRETARSDGADGSTPHCLRPTISVPSRWRRWLKRPPTPSMPAPSSSWRLV